MKRNIIALFSIVFLFSFFAVAVDAQTDNSNSTQNTDKKLRIVKKRRLNRPAAVNLQG